MNRDVIMNGQSICSATELSRIRGSFNYMQVSGGTWPIAQTPPAPGVYVGQASTPSWGIEMAASGDTTIDITTPGDNYTKRIQYDNRLNTWHLLW